MGRKRGSYRTVRRFFESDLPWPTLLWEFFRVHCLDPNHVYLLAGDETVVSKAGKHTHGVGRYFSSLYDQPIRGLSFFCLSLVSVETSSAWPLRMAQLLPIHKKRESPQPSPSSTTTPPSPSSKPSASTSKRSVGRPKGSKNKDKSQVSLNSELRLIQSEIQAFQATLNGILPLCYVLLDGHFGNNPATQMVRRCGLHIISKLRYDSKLFFPYQGDDKRRKYGERINPRHMPVSTLVDSSTEGDILTQTYQTTALHELFAHPLNVVIILKTNLKTNQQIHVILFSSDLELSYEHLVEYYSLRFQLEFVFRDAKQFWGLEDFMNRTERGVTNAANLAFFIVMLSQRLLMTLKPHWPDVSILDLKSFFRGYRYADEILKYL
ncbi:MAG: transposase, partial [Cyanobacteria bacterium P01_F01_bin.150]